MTEKKRFAFTAAVPRELFGSWDHVERHLLTTANALYGEIGDDIKLLKYETTNEGGDRVVTHARVQVTPRKVENKPPLGLTPRVMHTSQRILETEAAMARYFRADTEIPTEWVEERNDLLRKAKNISDSYAEDAVVGALSLAAKELHRQATERFDKYGPLDPRGAAIWDSASWIDPNDGDFLKIGRRKGEE